MKLLLWDIDGTLISAGRAGEIGFERALAEEFGVVAPTIKVINYHGRTDVFIAHALLQHYGIADTPENLHKLLDAYLRGLQEELPRATTKTHAGILHLLEAVRQRPDLVQGLLTGNLQKGARIKLEHFDHWRYFEFGAFADDSKDRNQLGPYALERARSASGFSFEPKDVYVIGDTPFDIECAHVIGANCIAVATGHYTVEQLKEHRPLVVLPDFSDPSLFFASIDGS